MADTEYIMFVNLFNDGATLRSHARCMKISDGMFTTSPAPDTPALTEC